MSVGASVLAIWGGFWAESGRLAGFGVPEITNFGAAAASRKQLQSGPSGTLLCICTKLSCFAISHLRKFFVGEYAGFTNPMFAFGGTSDWQRFMLCR